ncbi:MAG: ferrochelatase [Rhodospirillaceae bacterium]|nr:ferrochelatase [Rhodospirillaceae bacterium]
MTLPSQKKLQSLGVVLFNLGGPDCPAAVKPFLKNLFSDPAIIRLPAAGRRLLAWLIATLRAEKTKRIYRQVGGASPLREATERQARALGQMLDGLAEQVRVFYFMRYWHPLTEEAVAKINCFDPDRLLLIPLYPQFSTTTTGTSTKAFVDEAKRRGVRAEIETTCCYPVNRGFVDAMAARIRVALQAAAAHGKPRLLLSAHGLPQRIIASGDPYQWQVESTCQAIIASLDIPDLDWVTCYQSRLGPVRWIGPHTNDEIRRAGRDGVPVVVAPVAFVSENVETLVEIEIEYRHLAERIGVPAFHNVPAVGDDPIFISGLADLVRELLRARAANCDRFGRRCPATFAACPQRALASEMAERCD